MLTNPQTFTPAALRLIFQPLITPGIPEGAVAAPKRRMLDAYRLGLASARFDLDVLGYDPYELASDPTEEEAMFCSAHRNEELPCHFCQGQLRPIAFVDGDPF